MAKRQFRFRIHDLLEISAWVSLVAAIWLQLSGAWLAILIPFVICVRLLVRDIASARWENARWLSIVIFAGFLIGTLLYLPLHLTGLYQTKHDSLHLFGSLVLLGLWIGAVYGTLYRAFNAVMRDT